MKPLRIHILAALAFCLLPARADWTIKLPEPKSKLDISKEFVASEHGWILYALTNRLVWVSPAGEVLLDHPSDHYIRAYAILNKSQIWIQGGTNAMVVTVGKGLVPVTTKVRLPVGNFRGMNMPYYRDMEPDRGGIYAFDEEAWTLTRIEFPKPPVTSVAVQSAPTVAGPWTPVQSIEVPATAPTEFFRVEIKRP